MYIIRLVDKNGLFSGYVQIQCHCGKTIGDNPKKVRVSFERQLNEDHFHVIFVGVWQKCTQN